MTVKKTILCVDDEQSLSIQKVTLQTRGYRVVTCNTAVEAMEIFGHGGVDLVAGRGSEAASAADRCDLPALGDRRHLPSLL